MPGLINYIKKAFKNYPDTTTRISAENLNHLDDGIYDLDQQLGTSLVAEDDLKFNFSKSGNKYGYKDSNGNFIPFDRVQASKTVTASTSTQTVTPDTEYSGIASVIINPQQHTGTRATVTANGTIDLGNIHNIRRVPVAVPAYKIVKYVAVTKGNNAGGTVTVTRYDPNGTSQTRTTYCNSNESAGWPELSVYAWEHWQYHFFSYGTVYLNGSLRQGGSTGYFAAYDSGDAATHTHTVEVLVKA